MILIKTINITCRIRFWTGTLVKNEVLPVMGHVFWGLLGLFYHWLNQVADYQTSWRTKMGFQWQRLHPISFDDCIGMIYELCRLQCWEHPIWFIHNKVAFLKSQCQPRVRLSQSDHTPHVFWKPTHVTHIVLERIITLLLLMTESKAFSWLLQLVR